MKPRNYLTALLALAAVFLGSAVTSAHAADLQAALSSREAYVGAPIMLHLEVANASSHDEPTLPEVRGLDIQSAGAPSRSTQTTIINGRRTDRTSATYTWRITPRQAGTFEIPPIDLKVDGQIRSTRPMRFVATKSETGDLLFAEITGQQKEIYVGQPLTLTLNLWIKPYHNNEFDLTLSEENMWQMISEGTNWGAFTERMTELAENRQRPGGEEVLRTDSNGQERAYYQYQIEATVYPKKPGQIEVGDLQIVVDYPTRLAKSRDPFGSMFDDDFFGGMSPFGGRDFSPFRRNSLSVVASRPVVAEATVAPIDVKPVPTAGRPADYRGTVGQYQIVTQALPTDVKAGDPITLHIGIRGDGPMELVQAPPLAALPQLTADFKVANEPLAGLVEGDTKLFTTTIRPRREGITEIPAIPLTFFDPAKEAFVTVKSEPIAIHVSKAERLALDSIVGNPSSADRPHDDQASAAPTLDLQNYTRDDALTSSSSQGNWPWMLAMLLPPLAVALAWVVKHHGHLFTNNRSPQEQRIHAARHAIQTAGSPAEVASVANSLAAEIGNGADRAQLDQLLALCDQAAYSGSSDQQLPALKHQAIDLLDQVSRTTVEHRPQAATRMFGRRQMIATACLALAVLAVAVPVGSHFAGQSAQATADHDRVATTTPESQQPALPTLSDQQMAIILAEANTAYQDGRKASADDAAAAKEEFAQAATKYGQLVENGVRNSNLYVNLANAQLQLGATGKAIANYERALDHDPSNWQARNNLSIARSALHGLSNETENATSLGGLLSKSAEQLQSVLPPSVTTTMCASLWLALCGVILGSLVRPSRYWNVASLSVAGLLLVAVGVTNLERLTTADEPDAIVATQTAVLREAPGDQFPAIQSEALKEGEGLDVLKVDGNWVQIQTADGATGWVANPDVELL
ncbi:BatD family protein [Blastopirellula marina]|nr:BatD family protein [Blastopirellula marina]